MAFRDRLSGEMKAWVKDGLLTPGQSATIMARYPDQAKDNTTRVVIGIGATLLVVGSIIFVASNWAEIPASARIMGLAIVTGGLFWGGTHLIDRSGLPKSGHGLLVAGGGALGGLIFQIANTFHFQADNALLLIAWMAGIAPIAYMWRDHGLMLMSLILFPITIAMGFIANSNIGSLGVGILIFMGPGLLLLGVAPLHAQPWGKMRPPRFQLWFQGMGAIMMMVPAFVLTFIPAAWLENLWADSVTGGLAFALGSGLLGVGLVARKAEDEVAALTAAAGMGLVLVLGIGGSAALIDLAFMAAVIGIMIVAAYQQDKAWFNLGLLMFVVGVIGRYIEFAADFSNPAMAFILGGLVLLGVGFAAERVRRNVTTKWTRRV